jgi:UDP-glucose 4-epimerase
MILITGGAGYIGSQIVRDLLENDFKVVVIDSLELGHKKALLLEKVEFINADFSDQKILREIFSSFPIEAVVHMAAYSEVGESVANPAKYFKNNIENSKVLLEEVLAAGIKKIIFSSSASVYGEPKKVPIEESDPIEPINPYGKSKLEFEKMLEHSSRAENLKFISLRYFNAAGAELDGSIGEDHKHETHLVPLVLKAALGQRKEIEIFGNDYPTPDGTCIRDYVHVKDIANAHILALRALEKDGKSGFYNVGSGKGFSVKQIVDEAEKITGKSINRIFKNRREGDPAILITDNNKIRKELGWNPQYSDTETIIGSAWKWHSRHPEGYK